MDWILFILFAARLDKNSIHKQSAGQYVEDNSHTGTSDSFPSLLASRLPLSVALRFRLRFTAAFVSIPVRRSCKIIRAGIYSR
jgi:hypothetical protein